MDRIYVMELVHACEVGELSQDAFLQRAAEATGSRAVAGALLQACLTVPPNAPRGPVVEAYAVETYASLGAGETAASAQAGLRVETVQYPGPDGRPLLSYLARPADEEPHPAVVVIQEWWGLNDNIRDIARRFAAEGFSVLAPDLYHGVLVSEPDEARKLVMQLDMPAAVAEIRAGIGFLLSQPYVKGPKVGVTGFCMGGGLALQTALYDDRAGAVAAFYGRPLPPDQARQLRAPLLGLYGAEDQGIPVEAVREMEAAVRAAGISAEIHVYPRAGHAFFNDTRTSYNPAAAQDAWDRVLAWFQRFL